MGRTSINFSFVATIMLAASILIVSVPVALATTYEAYDEPPPSSPMCRNITETCLAYGDYTCCEGLSCIGGDSDLPAVALGVCTPLGEQQPPPKDKCRKSHQTCEPYGEYYCCKGLRCVDTRTLPPVAGVETRNLDLPPGVGVCEPI